MKRNWILGLVLCFVLPALGRGQARAGDPSEARLQEQVRHELQMIPYITPFDDVGFQVHGGVVTLVGKVTDPALKIDARNAAKSVEGVQRVDDKIEVLPLSPIDRQLRLQLYRAIYGYPTLQKYAMGVERPIRIIVVGGRVTLEGVVDSQSDKETAGIRANGVPGIFSVQNDLKVSGS